MTEQQKCPKCGAVVERWQGVLMPIAENDTMQQLTQAKARIYELIEENIDDGIAAGKLHEKYLILKSALSQPEKYPDIIKAEVKQLFDCAIRENKNVKQQAKFTEDRLAASRARIAKLEAIVDKLLTYSDGTPVTDANADAFLLYRNNTRLFTLASSFNEWRDGHEDHEHWLGIYPTNEAAEAAKKGTT